MKKPQEYAHAWILALRPKTLTASLVPIIVATAIVKAEGFEVRSWISITASLSALFIQFATNLLNDAIDFKKGADTETRVGPQRVTQSGLLSASVVMRAGFGCLVLALLFGIPLVVHGGWLIVVIGVCSLFLAYGYTGGPFPLAYLGLGDLFVILFFGLIAVGGTFFLHAQTLSFLALLAGLQIGCLAAVLIAINNFRDSPQDAIVGKRTLAVLLGPRWARIEIAVLVYLPFILGGAYGTRGLSLAAYAPLLSVPLASRIVRGIFSITPGPLAGASLNRLLAMAAALQLIFGIALAVGLWWGRSPLGVLGL